MFFSVFCWSSLSKKGSLLFRWVERMPYWLLFQCATSFVFTGEDQEVLRGAGRMQSICGQTWVLQVDWFLTQTWMNKYES